ncbi:hypothetical protein Aoki45_30480 [Algoriphagus sp. oki45]|nr:hypothetical protein Aoki45_30480 [Algoriphagus sp. oki45]
MQETPSPRIIFVGGSNLSFGLNSQMVKDSLELNPINTAIHAKIGLSYMLSSTERYIEKGDIIVLVPEYDQFYEKSDECSTELFRTIMDVQRSDIKLLNTEKYMSFFLNTFRYSISKFIPTEYFFLNESDIYSVNSFNNYGDVFAHWNMPKEYFVPYGKTYDKNFNQSIINAVIEFKEQIEKKGARLFVSFPSFQDISFENSLDRIERVHKEFQNKNINILGTPERYKMADSLMFNTPYHLNKIGVEYRTQLLIEDIKNKLAH